MKIKKGDTVLVIAGKDKGQQGKVLEVFRETERVRVEGLGLQKRHLKAGRSKESPEGGIVEREGSVHVSNVQLVDASSGKATRVGFKIDGDKKVRVGRGKLSGVVLDK